MNAKAIENNLIIKFLNSIEENKCYCEAFLCAMRIFGDSDKVIQKRY